MDEEEALREAAAVGDLRTELAAAEAREAAGGRRQCMGLGFWAFSIGFTLIP